MGNGKSLETAERRTKAIELHRLGHSFREIGRELGVSHVTIFKYVDATLKEYAEETKQIGQKYVEQELKRIDKMLKVWQPKAEDGDPVAMDKVVKLMERRSKYLGLDKPTKTEVDVSESLASLLLKKADKGE